MSRRQLLSSILLAGGFGWIGVNALRIAMHEHFAGRKHEQPKVNVVRVDVPEMLKCPVQFSQCSEGVFDTWSISHIAIYALAGIVAPGHDLDVFLLSILFEFWEWNLGFVGKTIDPFINWLGYRLGSDVIVPMIPSAWPIAMRNASDWSWGTIWGTLVAANFALTQQYDELVRVGAKPKS